VAAGIDFEPFGRGHRRRGDSRVGQDGSLRFTRAAAGRHDERVPVVHREGTGPWQAAVGRYDPGRAEDVEEALPGWRGEALVDRRDRTASVPGVPQLLDEVRAPWQVYCNEVGHIG
jgi:hypothetical protein